MSNSSVSIKFKWGLSASDPEQKPVLFVGQAAHLAALSWQDVRCKLEPKVSEEVSKFIKLVFLSINITYYLYCVVLCHTNFSSRFIYNRIHVILSF